MKEERIRCDYCGLEIYYSTSANPLRRFHQTLSIKEFTIDNSTRSIGGDFCSVDCLALKLKELVVGEPLKQDRLAALAKQLGYKFRIDKTTVIQAPKELLT